MRFCAFICILLASPLLLSAALALEPLHYEPAVVRLSGVVAVQSFYGPPNYGENPETDTVEWAIILSLDEVVTVLADPNSDLNSGTFNDVQRVQLVIPPGSDFASLAGAHVFVDGTLFQAHTAHHRTEVLMSVESWGMAPTLTPPP